jgi:hypothetical protein
VFRDVCHIAVFVFLISEDIVIGIAGSGSGTASIILVVIMDDNHMHADVKRGRSGAMTGKRVVRGEG